MATHMAAEFKPGGGLKPGGEPYTAAEIAKCGRRLGIDPIFEAHLLWVAEEALAAPLAEGWAEHWDEGTGAPFYLYTAADGSPASEVVWEAPLQAAYYTGLAGRARRGEPLDTPTAMPEDLPVKQRAYLGRSTAACSPVAVSRLADSHCGVRRADPVGGQQVVGLQPGQRARLGARGPPARRPAHSCCAPCRWQCKCGARGQCSKHDQRAFPGRAGEGGARGRVGGRRGTRVPGAARALAGGGGRGRGTIGGELRGGAWRRRAGLCAGDTAAGCLVSKTQPFGAPGWKLPPPLPPWRASVPPACAPCPLH